MIRTGERSAALDAVRIVGLIAIIAGHTWSGPMVHEWLYSWHVPVFFFLSGYLWKSGRRLGVEVAKRSRTILLPYAVWLVILGGLYVAVLVMSGAVDPLMIARLVAGGSYLERPFSAFWFMTALFVGCVALRGLEKGPSWCRWAVALVAVVCGYVWPSYVAAVPLSAGVGIACLVFVLAGTSLRGFRCQIRHPGVVGALGVAIGFSLVVSRVSEPLDLKASNFGTPVASVVVAVLISGGLVLLAEAAFSRLRGSAGAIVSGVASVGFMVMLIHAVPLWVLKVGSAGSVIGFLWALVPTWLAALVIRRTPLSPWLIGVSASRRPVGSHRLESVDSR